MTRDLGSVLGSCSFLTSTQPSMTRASYCCHVILLKLFLKLMFVSANMNTSANTSPYSSSLSMLQSLPAFSQAKTYFQMSAKLTKYSLHATPFSIDSQLKFLSSGNVHSSHIKALQSPSLGSNQSLQTMLDTTMYGKVHTPHKTSEVGMSVHTPHKTSEVGMLVHTPHKTSEVGMLVHTPHKTSEVGMSVHTPHRTSEVGMLVHTPHRTSEVGMLTDTKRAKFELTASKKDAKMLEVVEKLFLKQFGLEKRPKIPPGFAVSEHMLDLYHIQQQKSLQPGRQSRFRGNGLLSGNTVRSFLHTDLLSKTCLPPLCSSMFFNISAISEHEIITGAELRIFADTTHGEAEGDSEVSSSQSGQLSGQRPHGISFRVEVYEIMRPETVDHGAISRLLDTLVISTGNSSWHSFDIRPAVLKWKSWHHRNHGLEIRVVSNSTSHAPSSGIRLRQSDQLSQNKWSFERPLLVIYTDDGSISLSSSRSEVLTRLRRKKRQILAGASKDKTRKLGNSKKKRKHKRRRKKKGHSNICQRHALYVNFRDVGWDDWIVAPPGYNAYYCHGDCVAPLPHFTKSSNHAMLQARLYKVNPGAVPMVACIPTKMSPISMLYINERGTTTMKNYHDMSVDECGCQ